VPQVGLPGHELLVTDAPREDREIENACVTADRAFDEAERQLAQWVQRNRQGRRDTAPVD
jgi:hypothetical protein